MKSSEEMKKSRLDEMMLDLEQRGILPSSERRFAETLERGRVLSRIKKSKLYRSAYRSFSAFVEDKFECTSQQARNLIMTSEVYDELDNGRFDVMPRNSKQCMDIAAESKRTGCDVSEVWRGMLRDCEREGNDEMEFC